MINSKKIYKDLSKVINKEHLSENIFERIAYGQDAANPDLTEEQIPFVVAKPETVEETSKVVAYANQNKIPIYIHGAGTAFKGSPKPKYSGSILLSTEGLTNIEMHEEDMYVELGAGVNQYKLEKLLDSLGYMMPMNIGSKYASTIGGAAAINTIGHMVDICLGKLIDHIMGVEVVLPNGEIIETGTKSIRRPAGLDYTRFFVGNEGLFGVITKVRMRLLPAMYKAYVVGFFPDLTDIAHAFIRHYTEKNPPPLYGELLDKDACRSPFKLRGLGEPKGDMALATTIGYTQEEADLKAQNMVNVFKAERAIEAFVVTSKKDQQHYWESRDNILNILQSEGENEKLVMVGGLESAMPLSRAAEAIEYIRDGHGYEDLKEAKLYIYGHIGTCDLHGMWVAPVDWTVEKKQQCSKDAIRLEGEINSKWGCVSGEIGQTASRIPFFKKRYGNAAYEMLTNVKKAIDPNNILNPGNLEGVGYE